MAETYGTLPTDVLDRSFSDYWLNAGIWAAVQDWKDDARSRQQAAQTSAGVASAQEKEDLVDAQEARADRREQGDRPDPTDQMDWIREQRQQAQTQAQDPAQGADG